MTLQTLRSIPRPVLVLGLVSLFNDFASEMIYPLIPLFLTATLGAPAPILGLLEGLAEATAGIVKFAVGYFSDRIQQRKKFVVFGYSLAAISKALMSLAATWGWVLTARLSDRFGKGIRTAPRDALLSELCPPEIRGTAFGIHRALDSFGAVLGPLAALALITWGALKYQTVFAFSAIPSLAAVLLVIFFIHDIPRRHIKRQPHPLTIKNWDRRVLKFLALSFIFSLGNSSDAFLILRAHQLGLSDTATVLSYVTFNFAFSLLSVPAGVFFDRGSPRTLLFWGFILFSAIYAGFGMASGITEIFILFAGYGAYMAMSDGIAKAFLSKLAPPEALATVLGAHQLATSAGTLVASVTAGLLWQYISPQAPFFWGAGLSFVAGMLFLALFPRTASPSNIR